MGFFYLMKMEAEDIYKLYLECGQNVCTDTRQIIHDSLFIALKGDNFNGSKFAQEALNKGCKFAIIDDPDYQINDRTILVEDSLKILQSIANLHRKTFSIPVVAITGTNGKTTTKELIAAILQKKYNTTFTSGNFNNHIGVPLTLLRIKKETEIAIIEMGANHPGEIKALCEIAEPDYGIITNVGKAHLEGFGSFEGVIKTKTEMYHYIKNFGKGLFVNANNNILMKYVMGNNLITYSESHESDIMGKNPSSDPLLAFEWKTKNDLDWETVTTNLVGIYNFENVLAAICIGNYFKVNKNDIKSALDEYTPTNNRSQVLKTKSNTLILDAYNANPTSMTAAINNFKLMNGNNKAMIIGDMRELGSDSMIEHKIILDLILESKISDLYLVGDVFCNISSNSNYKTFTTVELFIDYIKLNPLKDKLILVKGSHGVHLERTIEYL